MSTQPRMLTAAQEILLAAFNLEGKVDQEFSEWDLTVATWKRSPNRFGCRGYETEYPDHKRVMMEIMGKTKRDNPIRRGWMMKVRPNHYCLTALGRAEAERISSRPQPSGATSKSKASAAHVYDAVAPYLEHKVFRSFCRDPDEPKMWLSAAAFLGITQNTMVHVQDRLCALESSIRTALTYLNESEQDSLRRGPTGGGFTVRREDLEALDRFRKTLLQRFSPQFARLLGPHGL